MRLGQSTTRRAAVTLWLIATALGATRAITAPTTDRQDAVHMDDRVVAAISACDPARQEHRPQCMEALERAYMPRVVAFNSHSYPGGEQEEWWPLPLEDQVTWREVFRSPVALRKKVEAALLDPVCQVERGRIAHDQRERCAANAMARLAVLQRTCSPMHDLEWSDEDWQEEWHLWANAMREDAETEEKRRQLDGSLVESELHFTWRLEQCARVPREATLPLAALPTPPSEYSFADQSGELLARAARLGSDWALVRSVGTITDINALAKSNLALAYLHRAKRRYLLTNLAARQAYVAYVLVARHHDLAGDSKAIDWRGIDEAFSPAEVRGVARDVQEVLASGWIPLPRPEPENARNPIVRRWRDEDGNERVRFKDGKEAIVAVDGTVDPVEP